ncbi:olee1-like protein [Prunus yedoensis var. nudiflora]|uniref:Olee1-like protein n=1 Tax=Prunus yedoensis var. nudiflora TaxID=2094558 RepID=A0A314XUN9_PRUYE|nr:olee1-like protein [Prunus yedoensis var. nudiflora]
MSTKSSTTILGFAFCFLSLLNFAYSNTTDDKIYLSGLVYCDNCQLKSMTEISKMIPGAKVRLELLQSPDPECKISHEVDPNNKSKTAPVATRKLNLLEGDSVVFIGPSHRVSYPLGLVVDNARPECEQFAKARKHFQN